MTIRLITADDHPIVRLGLRRLVEREPDMALVAEADTADALFEALEGADADVLLLDVAMPGPGVIEVIRRLRSARPALRVLVLSIYPEGQYGVRVLRAGAAGYITKEQSPELLVRAVRAVHAGRRFVSADLAELLALRVQRGYETAPHERLSDREHEVLVGLGAGMTVKDVAEKLGLSPKTVSTYRTRLLEKLALASNADLVRYVRQQELGGG